MFMLNSKTSNRPTNGHQSLKHNFKFKLSITQTTSTNCEQDSILVLALISCFVSGFWAVFRRFLGVNNSAELMTQNIFCERFLLLLASILSLPCLIIMKPINMAYDFFTIYHPNIFGSRNSPLKHARKVENIQKQVWKHITTNSGLNYCCIVNLQYLLYTLESPVWSIFNIELSSLFVQKPD
jgi:hypothetical protein